MRSSFGWRWSLAVLLGSIISMFCQSDAPALSDNSFGTWSLGNSAPGHLLAAHATLLRNNKILVVGGSSYNCCYTGGREESRLYDIANGTWGPKLPSPAPYGPQPDAFCSGHAHDDSGGVVFQGGLLGYGDNNGVGIGNTARYDFSTGLFTRLNSTAVHWYPTLVAGVKDIFLFPGRNTGGGTDIRKMTYGTSAWATTGRQHVTRSTYPRAVLLPNGKIFVASPAEADRKNYLYDPGANTLTLAGNDVVPESSATAIGEGDLHAAAAWLGSGVLLPLVPSQGDYPSMKFALTNGINAYVKDPALANPTWQVMGTRPPELGSPSPRRRYAHATLLPTEHVLVTGGVERDQDDSMAVKEAEVYDPGTNSWLLTSAATVARNYHASALLLPDGRVWTASGSQNTHGSECDGSSDGCQDPSDGLPENTEEQVEIFTPWYFGSSDRPVITGCPAKISTDGGSYHIGIGNSQGTNVGRVVLMRPGSVTHSFDTDQRLIRLDITNKTASTVTVKAPYGAPAAPPGDYMMFALRSIFSSGFEQWVPSVACWTRVEPQVARHDVPAASYQHVFDSIVSKGYRPLWVDGYEVGSGHRFNTLFTNANIQWVARHNMDDATYQKEFDKWVGQGFRLAQVDSYLVGGQIRYAAIWEMKPGPLWTAYHGVTEATHQANFNQLVSEGDRPVNISAVNVGGTRFFAALYDQANVGKFFTLTGTEAKYQTEFNNQVASGKVLAYVDAFMESGVPKISAIWNQHDQGAWVARHGIDSDGYKAEFDKAIGQGLQTRAVAGYETGGTSRFIALWSKK